MAAQDTTVSLAGASTTINAYRLSRDAMKGRLPVATSLTAIAASGSSVFNLGVGEALIIERSDAIEPLINTVQLRQRENFSL